MEYTKHLLKRFPHHWTPKDRLSIILVNSVDEFGKSIIVRELMDSSPLGKFRDFNLNTLIKAGVNPQSTASVNTSVTDSRLHKETIAQDFLNSLSIPLNTPATPPEPKE